jgi:hypothetical protein
MTGIYWWLVDVVSRTLEPDERTAVRGDFAESGETGGQALRDVVGLVARRQAALWKDWRPWVALIGIVGLIGALLIFSLLLADVYELYSWIARNYSVIDKKILVQTGLTLRHGIVILACNSFLLISCSWTGGFALASLSRRTLWVNAVLFCFVWLLSPLKLFRLVFLLPLIWGVCQGLRLGTLRRRQAIFLAVAIVSATALAIWTGGWWGWSQCILTLALGWPVWYLVATASPQFKESNS